MMSHLHTTKKLFENIATKFDLEMIVNENDPVEYSVTFPIQEKLSHKIGLNLQNDDELHFCIRDFWYSIFPISNDACIEFQATVEGFIRGESRIVEYKANNNCYKSVLEEKSSTTEKTLFISSRTIFEWPWAKKTEQIIWNDSARHTQ